MGEQMEDSFVGKVGKKALDGVKKSWQQTRSKSVDHAASKSQ